MSSLAHFNEEKIAERMMEKARERLESVNTTGELLEEDLAIVFEFTKIAVGLVKNELSEHLDDAHAKQLIVLFAKCLVQAIVKSDQHGIEGELKIKALQALALDIFGMSKDHILLAMAEAGNPNFDTTMEDSKKELKRNTMQRLKFHITQLQQMSG